VLVDVATICIVFWIHRMVRIVNNQRNIRQQQQLLCFPYRKNCSVILITCFFIGIMGMILSFFYISVQYTQHVATYKQPQQQHVQSDINVNVQNTILTTDKIETLRKNKSNSDTKGITATTPKTNDGKKDTVVITNVIETSKSIDINDQPCPYMKLTDLTNEERYPKMGDGSSIGYDRHMITPPHDGNVTLVCCHTTVGSWNIIVHFNWAPIGAQRFIDMVRSQYFNSGVPLMRCIKDFLCQFGLNGQPTSMKLYKHTLKDDPNWLPEGPNYRFNQTTGVKRFSRGYMAYAGAGKHSRDLQFIVALKNNGPLGGGSPWEVPWGELVGEHSYTTLSKIYTGYDEHGPSQGLLYQANAIDVVKEKYPLIDYIQSCRVVDQYIDKT
jgi:cyclophilin family peptidyl-prolyl cis-trans isomerase